MININILQIKKFPFSNIFLYLSAGASEIQTKYLEYELKEENSKNLKKKKTISVWIVKKWNKNEKIVKKYIYKLISKHTHEERKIQKKKHTKMWTR